MVTKDQDFTKVKTQKKDFYRGRRLKSWKPESEKSKVGFSILKTWKTSYIVATTKLRQSVV